VQRGVAITLPVLQHRGAIAVDRRSDQLVGMLQVTVKRRAAATKAQSISSGFSAQHGLAQRGQRLRGFSDLRTTSQPVRVQ
jgi:hypothetical protein